MLKVEPVALDPSPKFIADLKWHLPDIPLHLGANADPGLWNAARRDTPLARLECGTAAEVAAALRVAGDHGVPIAVFGGRHSLLGGCAQRDHLVIDLRRMSEVSHRADRVSFGGGATAQTVLAALPDDTVTVTGVQPTVGMTALTLGGGYGMLNGRYGMACDLVLEAKMVLADGHIVRVDAGSDPDLFWAIRGGGTGFGVVTELTLATRKLPLVLSAMLMVPLNAAASMLLAVQEMIDLEPDDVGLFPMFMVGPDGAPALFVPILWSGDAEGGERWLDRLCAREGVHVLDRRWIPYRRVFEVEDLFPAGRHCSSETGNVTRIDATVAEMLVEAARDMPGPRTYIFIHDLHGAATRVDPSATAFPARAPHFVLLLAGVWDADASEDEEQYRRWVGSAYRRLGPVMHPGGYINFLAPHMADRVRLAYGSSADRLLAIKHRVDAHGTFARSTGRFS